MRALTPLIFQVAIFMVTPKPQAWARPITPSWLRQGEAALHASQPHILGLSASSTAQCVPPGRVIEVWASEAPLRGCVLPKRSARMLVGIRSANSSARLLVGIRSANPRARSWCRSRSSPSLAGCGS